MTQQSEALRLSDWLEDQYDPTHNKAQAAAELRRLHEAHDWQYRMAGERLRRVEKLEAQRDALLEALKLIVEFVDAPTEGKRPDVFVMRISKARAAIAKAEESAMTTLREAAQQALEVLEADCGGRCNAEYNPCWQREVAETLRAALAEPVQEPVAGRAFLERILAAMEGVIDVADRKTDEFDALRSCVIDLTLMLHTAPPQRPAEPVQEPVAWIQPDHLQKARQAPFLCRVEPTQRCADFVPLYTAPQQRPPLTKERNFCPRCGKRTNDIHTCTPP